METGAKEGDVKEARAEQMDTNQEVVVKFQRDVIGTVEDIGKEP